MILIANNSELAAKYMSNDVAKSIRKLEIKNIDNDFFKEFGLKQKQNFFIQIMILKNMMVRKLF